MAAAAESGAASRRPTDPKAMREIVTPEGVPLRFELASRSDRAAGLVIDLTIMIALVIGLMLAVAFLAFGGMSFSGWALGIGLLGFFVLRNFYFTFFELRWHGVTPGKRVVGTRVIDRHGGRLKPEAIFARNLMREVELFLPITLILAANATGAADWSIYLALIWTGVFALMPLFNKDRMRTGDIVGGTWVIKAPRFVLQADMAQAGSRSRGLPAGTPVPTYSFTREQLEIYGIYELQTLEAVLRQTGPTAYQTQAEVCGRIQRKIGWKSDRPVQPVRFLEAFYAALRGHLENRMLLGERRESKHDAKGPGPEPE
jgi:uncharacterized RDD family membrane protein YckC